MLPLKKKIQANMKEQQETNNASPAAAVNLQMWPSAPREEGGEGVRQGGAAAPSAFPSTKPAPNVQPRPLLSCQPATAPLRTSGPPPAPLLLLWTQPEEGRCPCSSPLSSLLLTSELPTQQGLQGQAGSFTDHFCLFLFFSSSSHF